MLSTVSSVPLELNSSYYTPGIGNNGLDGLSVNESENTTANLYMLPAYLRTTSMVVCIIVMVLGIIGNLMVPLVVFRGKDMRNSTNIFLVNLSVADLCVLLICTPTVLFEVNSGPQIWPLGEHMCKAVPFVELTVAHASVLTILAISFERYYAICEPLRVGYMCTKARATFLCLVAWVAAALCTSPIIWVSQYQEMRVKGVKSDQDARNIVPVCLTMADTSATVVFFLLLVILFYLAPLLILLILYTLIIRQLIPDPGNTSDSYHARAKKHVITMLLSVVISFFICLSPYRILIFYIVVAPVEQIAGIDRDTFFTLLNFSRIMFYLHSAVDPILYNLMSTKFRRGFLGLCKTKRYRSSGVRSNATGTKRTNSSEQEENFVPILLMVKYEEEMNLDGSYIPTCNTEANSNWTIRFVLFTIIVFFMIPLLILVVLYTVIARHLMTNPTISRGSSNNLLKYRKQVMLMLGTVVLCFFLCLLPFRALTLWILIVPTQVIVNLGVEGYFTLLHFCRVMLYLNSAINPIIYNLMSSKFREGFLRLCGLVPNRRKKKKSSEKTGTYTTGSTNCSSNHSDFWRRHSSNKSSSAKVSNNSASTEKQTKVPLQTSVVSGTIGGKKQESYV